MINLMTPGQWAYLIALAVLFAWRGPSYGAWVLLVNAVVTLAVLGAMDQGFIDHTDKTLFLMLTDFLSGAVLLMASGLPRFLAIGYAVTVPVYAANIIFSVSEATTFAVVIAIGILQIAVAGIGHSGDGGGGLHRRADVLGTVVPPGRIANFGADHMAASFDHVAQNSRGE